MMTTNLLTSLCNLGETLAVSNTLRLSPFQLNVLDATSQGISLICSIMLRAKIINMTQIIIEFKFIRYRKAALCFSR